MQSSFELTRVIRQGLNEEWSELWSTRYDDKITAEGISTKQYHMLDIDKGQVLCDSRGYRLPPLEDLYEDLVGREVAQRIYPSNIEGGWRKFAKTHFQSRKKPAERPKIKVDLRQPQRKGGSGWLNRSRTMKKARENRD